MLTERCPNLLRMDSDSGRSVLIANVRLLVVVAIWVACVGTVHAADSVTVFASQRTRPWVQRLGEQYGESHPDVHIDVISDDSQSGIRALLKGTVAATVLARSVTEKEIHLARYANKTQLVGIPVAADAVILFVRPDNPAGAITLEQIKGVFTHKITEWPQLGVSMVESAAEEVARKRIHRKSSGPLISRHTPDDHFGSVDVLHARTMGHSGFTEGRVAYDSRRDLVHAVGADRFGLGFAGMGYVQGVKTLAVRRDAESLPVLPTPETLRNRSYPLAHYQYFYFAGQPSGPVKGFLTFVLSEEGQRMIDDADAGPVSLPFQSE